MTRVDVKDGRLVFPDGMSYRILWLPTGTFLLPETEAKIAALEKKGARVIRGDFTPDWPSPLKAIGQTGRGRLWYQRRDGAEDVFFIVEERGRSWFLRCDNKDKKAEIFDPMTDEAKSFNQEMMKASCYHKETTIELKLKPCADCPAEATECKYAGTFVWEDKGEVALNLGKVCHWATVRMNGKVAARLWCEPYCCDITPFVRPGENEICVEVTPTLHNRLVIDAAKPEAERTTWVLGGPKAGAPLVDAGLYGPVTLEVVK